MKGDRKMAKNAVENAQEIMDDKTGDFDGEISDILIKSTKVRINYLDYS